MSAPPRGSARTVHLAERRRALVVPAVGGIAALVFELWLLFGWGGGAVTTRVDDTGECVAAFAAAACCLFAARRCAREYRRAWVLLSASTAAWGTGQVAWSVYELGLGQPVPFPGLPDVGFLASAVLAAWAVVVWPSAAQHAASRTRALLDGAITAAAVLFLSWSLVLGTIYRTSGAGSLSAVIGLAYPLSDIAIVSLVVIQLTSRSGKRMAPLMLVGAGLILMSVSDSTFAVLTTAGTFSTGNAFDGGWSAGFLLIALGARLARPGDIDAPQRESATLAQLMFPYLPLLLAGLLSATRVITDHPLDLVEQTLFTALGTLIITRQLVALLDTHQQRQRLESEVEVRTEELHHQACYDALTGLANRPTLSERLTAATSAAPRAQTSIAVLLLDVDSFEIINDALGHTAGDRLLVTLADRFRALTRPGDLAARLGGDEFAFLLNDVVFDSDAVKIAERLLAAVSAPVVLEGRQIVITASVGVVLADSPMAGDDLLRNADVAMHAAKEQGKDRVRLFEPSMHGQLLERLALESGLRQAMERGELEVHYQPTVDIATGRCVGTEALVRWQHPDRGLVTPSEFIPIAEANGLIVPLGAWVLLTACRQARAWQLEHDDESLHLNVNLSPRQLVDEGIVDHVRDALAISGLPAHSLVLEITEGILVRDPEVAVVKLERLKALGVRLALDDFGTGYSALGSLHRFPIDVLKIDQSFVSPLHRGRQDAALVRAVISLGQALGLEVVAEGIDRQEHVSILKEMCCDTGQGYFYARPMPAEQMKHWLADSRRPGIPSPREAVSLTA